MKFMYGETSNDTEANDPLTEASIPRPVSGFRPGSPISYVDVGASTPKENNSSTVGGLNERETVSEVVQCSSAFHRVPTEALNEFEDRRSLLRGNAALGEVWIVNRSYRRPIWARTSPLNGYSSNTYPA